MFKHLVIKSLDTIFTINSSIQNLKNYMFARAKVLPVVLKQKFGQI